MKLKIVALLSTVGMLCFSGSLGSISAADKTDDTSTRVESVNTMPMIRMQEQMKKMRTQMDEIRKTDDPDKRDALIKSHRESMHKMMGMMQNMGVGHTMQDKEMNGQKDKKSNMMDGKRMDTKGMQGKGMMDPETRMQNMQDKQTMMEQHMEMMQMMMDHMMQNQDAKEQSMMMRDRRMEHRKAN